MNPFAEKYKTLSAAELLNILAHPGDYQPLAIEAAQIELESRQLSEAELTGANAENQQKEDDKQAQATKVLAFKNKISDAGNDLIDTIHPVQRGPVSLNRIIILISIVFGIYGVIHLWQGVYYAFILMRYSHDNSFRLFAPSLFQGIYLILTALLFWRRGKWGWIFLSGYLCFSLFGAVAFSFMMAWRYVILPHSGDFSWRQNLTWVPFTLLFYSCCTWFTYRRSVRSVYNVDKYLAIITAATGVFMALLIFFIIAR